MTTERNAAAVERGKKLRELRLKRGLTQAQIAERVDGWNQSRVASFERGDSDLANATFRSVLQLSSALGCAVSKLAKII
ncbi:helix-turn-helix domain-containing protein [Bifidobacterium magnum]|uniref:helix-turn-helix domain-containing protein n=1 Tax=Bifidobacterium magnum TaxID=1692 RepID=UPI0009DBF835